MTEDNMQVLRDDLAFMRDLAHDGSNTPLLFGGVMVAAGLIFGVASVGHWLIASGVLRAAAVVADGQLADGRGRVRRRVHAAGATCRHPARQ